MGFCSTCRVVLSPLQRPLAARPGHYPPRSSGEATQKGSLSKRDILGFTQVDMGWKQAYVLKFNDTPQE